MLQYFINCPNFRYFQECLLEVNKKKTRVPCWDNLFQMISLKWKRIRENLKLLECESCLIKQIVFSFCIIVLAGQTESSDVSTAIAPHCYVKSLQGCKLSTGFSSIGKRNYTSIKDFFSKCDQTAVLVKCRHQYLPKFEIPM